MGLLQEHCSRLLRPGGRPFIKAQPLRHCSRPVTVQGPLSLRLSASPLAALARILTGYRQKGFDRRRPVVGICVKITSEAGKKKVIEHKYLPLLEGTLSPSQARVELQGFIDLVL